MSIVRMKRLRLIGLLSHREALLRELQDLGCVQIDELKATGDEADWAGLVHPDAQALDGAKARCEQARAALDVLGRYAPEKKGLLEPMPTASQAELFDDARYTAAGEAARALCALEREKAALDAEAGKLQARRKALEPWLGLDVPLETASTPFVTALFGALPVNTGLAAVEEALGQAGELCALTPAGADRDMQYFFFLCHKSVEQQALDTLQSFGLSRVSFRDMVGTAAENDAQLEREYRENRERSQALALEMAAYGGKRRDLELSMDRAVQERSREEAKSRLLDTQETFCLLGWFPAEDEGRVKALLERYPCAWESADPAEEEYPQVPVKLKNGRVSRCMNTITEMYSLPAYDGIDANPLMAPFFIVIFGLMMADMAYGLLIMLGTGIYLKKARPKDPYFMEMLFWCGISTFIVGALTGGFLGDFIPQLLSMMGISFTMPALFSPMNDTLAIMVGSVALGFLQIVTGMAVSVVHKTRKGDFLDALFNEITWWIILAGLAVWLCASMLAVLPPALGTVGLGMLIAGGLMLVFGGTRKAKGFGKVTSLVGIVYNGVTGFFSDALSYVRIMALMLSGSVIASVFNTLGATTGLVPVFIVISLLGNLLNFALCVLGAYVHDLRLQCLEFFGRFYEEGGTPYRPLSIDTNYVKIIKEEN